MYSLFALLPSFCLSGLRACPTVCTSAPGLFATKIEWLPSKLHSRSHFYALYPPSSHASRTSCCWRCFDLVSRGCGERWSPAVIMFYIPFCLRKSPVSCVICWEIALVVFCLLQRTIFLCHHVPTVLHITLYDNPLLRNGSVAASHTWVFFYKTRITPQSSLWRRLRHFS